mgnify:CR=1 FL=1
MSKQKRAVNYNLIAILIVSISLFVVVVMTYLAIGETEQTMNGLGREIAEGSGADHVMDDVEGYATLINSAVYGLGFLGLILMKIFLFWIPLLNAIVFSVNAIVARVLYQPYGSKLSAYRVLMGVTYAEMFLFIPFMALVVTAEGIPSIAVYLVMILYIVMQIIGAYNTFSKRIVCKDQQVTGEQQYQQNGYQQGMYQQNGYPQGMYQQNGYQPGMYPQNGYQMGGFPQNQTDVNQNK